MSQERRGAPDTRSRTAHFIVSTGRCGSTLLTRMLAAHPSLLAISEFFSSIGPERAFHDSALGGESLWRLMSECPPGAEFLLRSHSIPEVLQLPSGGRLMPIRLATLPGMTPDVAAVCDELRTHVIEQPMRSASAAFTDVFEWMANRFQKGAWIERSGGSLQYVSKLLELWPGAKCIHLWRKGAECALSMSRHPYFRVAVARAVARDPDLSVETCLKRTMALDRFGAFWSAVTVQGLGALRAQRPERILHLSFESLISDPRKELERVARFLALRPDEDWVNRAGVLAHRAPSGRPDVSAGDWAALERVCRPGQRALIGATRPVMHWSEAEAR